MQGDSVRFDPIADNRTKTAEIVRSQQEIRRQAQ